jgi:HK97 gp10 family phage protein
MPRRVTVVKVEGFRELEQALKALPRATGKNVVRRTLQKASKPFIDAARAAAPRATGQLAESIKFSSRLSKRQARLARQETKSTIEVHAGATALPHAHLVEYGTHKMAPRPFMRSAWDANKRRALDIIRDEMGNEIMKAAKRLEAKARRQALKRGK